LTIADFTESYNVFRLFYGFFLHITMYTDGVTELTCSISCGS